jgi:hypothetical protein
MNSIEKFNFENLRVYQDALDFSKQVYKISRKFPKGRGFWINVTVEESCFIYSIEYFGGEWAYKNRV